MRSPLVVRMLRGMGLLKLSTPKRAMSKDSKLEKMAKRMYERPAGRGLDECSGDPNGPRVKRA